MAGGPGVEAPPLTTTTQDRSEVAEIVRSLYDAFDRRDIETVLGLFDADIEIRQSDELPWGGTYRGAEGAVDFLTALASHVDTRVEIDRLVVAGDTVVESGRTCGRACRSGREFAIDETHVWQVRDGRVVRMEAYVDHAAMLAALSGE